MYPTRRLFTVSYYNASNGYFMYYVLELGTDGSVISRQLYEYAPLTETAAISGQGLYAINVGNNNSYRELLFMWCDSRYAYYISEWECRINSHPRELTS